MKRKPVELITDPASGQLSMSRLCLGVLILAYIPVLIILDALGYKMDAWAHLALIVGSVAGVYGINSGVRVWRGRVIKEDK